MTPANSEPVEEIQPPAPAEDIESLKKALEEQKTKAEANLAGWQRAQADFINYKRFCEQEKTDVIKFANTQLMTNILPILDDLERALGGEPPKSVSQSWLEGLRLIERKLRSALELQGLTRIQAMGEEFDPCVHEAVSCGKGKKDTVVLELQPGYRLHDRVLRPAKVIVGTGEEEEKKEK